MKTQFTIAAGALLMACAPAWSQAPASMLAPATAIDDSLYRGLGGKEGIGRIVGAFLPLVQADPRIRDSFKDVDMVQLGRRLGEQFCELAGGPCRYTGKYKGKDMQSVHVDLQITDAQFNALAEDLQQAMDGNGIAYAIQNRLVARLAPMRRDIVTR